MSAMSVSSQWSILVSKWSVVSGRGNKAVRFARHHSPLTTHDSRLTTDDSRRGQVTLEYFILFAAATLIAVAGLTSSGFWGQLAKTVEDFVNAAATKITN